ncbi:ankyrin repeat domain-containing protein [Nitrosomonas aestuarii]|uniref:ankyrin repeat domain-containing protein n=1 Tax=Nitrosomonas aestuarii TaxID=52441 RepID=UPI000D31A9C8|nr:ankyrin repeat domain-containing protein [Nitrosomonas aestuarii]PTN11148.1 type II secretory pathway predicted ATPase ExeA [Nitrosomonas aestuarii]
MYSQRFGLHKNPFSQLVQQSTVYLSDSHQLVFNQLTACIEKSTGVVSLLGPAGVGKSTLIVSLVEAFLQDKEHIYFKDLSAFITGDEWSETSEYDFSGVIEAVLEDSLPTENGHCKSVYLLDAADTINEDALTKLLTIIAGRNANEDPTLFILVGRPRLEQLLNTVQHGVDKHLLIEICRLDSFNTVEVRNYINHRMHIAHYTGAPLFTEDAIGAIATLSNGIPRYINSICGMSLFKGDKKRLSIVTDKIIYDAGESCLLDDDNEFFPLQKDTEKSGIPDPASVPAPKHKDNGFTTNTRGRYLFKYLGTASVIIIAATVIAVQWYSASQPVDDSGKTVMLERADVGFHAAEVSQDKYLAQNKHETDLEIASARIATDAVDSDDHGAFQQQSAESQSYNSIDEIQELLAQARMLEQRNRLTLPQDNNAIAAYQHILGIQPENVEAIQGIERIKQKFLQQAKRASSQSQWKNAQSNLLKVKQIDPDNNTIDTLLADVQARTMKTSQHRMVDQQELAARNRANARYKLNSKGIEFDLMIFLSHAEHGNADLVALFLDANMPVDAQDAALGDTALIKAATYGHSNTVKLILSRHANINMQNRIGRTALMNAIVFEQYDIAFDLLNQGIDIHIRDKNGWNALMFAVQKNRPDLIEALLRKGANSHVRNVLGQSAFSMAKEKGNNAIFSLLQTKH